MGRIRTIKPELPQSETLGRVSRDARLLFIMLWTIVDDAGRTRGAARLLAGLLFPYDADAPEHIEGWLGELEAVGCIRRYVVDGSTYLDIPNWLRHQKIERPSKSKLPAFDEGSPNPHRSLTEPSTTDLGPRTVDLGPGKSISSAPSRDDAKPADDSPVVLEFPTVGKGGPVWKLTQRQLDDWSALFPALDVLAEARAALAWCVANPGRRKTTGGMPKFLVNWLTRSQERGKAQRPVAPRHGSQPESRDGWWDERQRLHGDMLSDEEFERRYGSGG